MSEQGKRVFSRVPFSGNVSFKSEDKLYHGELLDISLKGIALKVETPSEIPENSKFHMIFPLLESEDKAIEMDIRAVHIDGNVIGFKWESVDLDSFFHLRRLLEINLHDDALLDREISALIEP